MTTGEWTRRGILQAAGSGAVVLGLASAAGAASEKNAKKSAEEDVSPNEDLMREHGLLDRVMLVYDDGLRRIEAKQEMPPEVFAACAGIVRRFMEDYHEKLEEDFLFPRLEKAGQQVELVATLRAQHLAGRRLTETIQTLATPAGLGEERTRATLVESVRLFVRMYRPHAAREDTVLFPAFHRIVSHREYDALGEQFEDEEHRRFGADGFEKILDEVANLERQLGIHDLAGFTPV